MIWRMRYLCCVLVFTLSVTPSLCFVGNVPVGSLAKQEALKILSKRSVARAGVGQKSVLCMSGRPGGDDSKAPPGIDQTVSSLPEAAAAVEVKAAERERKEAELFRSQGLPYGYPPPPPTLSKAQEALIKSVIEKSKGSTKMKRVEFKSSGKAIAKVNDTNVGSNVTLGTYMTLPAEQWVTLDERFITRLNSDDKGKGKNAVEYRFTLPLKQFMQLPLTATCDVSVNIDEKSQLLRLEATGAKLRPSTKEDDALPAPNISQSNASRPMAAPTLPPNFTQSIEQAAMEVAFRTSVKWQESSASSLFGVGGAKPAQLDLNTEVSVGMTLPPPLSFLPTFLLKQAGGLVLRAACATILPRFGELVAEDYRRWSRGEPRVGGSLAPSLTPQQVQQLEGRPYYFPPPAELKTAVDDRLPKLDTAAPATPAPATPAAGLSPSSVASEKT